MFYNVIVSVRVNIILDMKITVFIEIPKGSPQKYEFDEDLGVIKLDRTLFSPMYFPFEYGHIENTRGEDKDPLDVVLLATFPTFPGCYVKARPVGLLLMEDEAGIDHKVIAVPDEKVDPRFKEIKNVNDLSSHIKKEIKEFFENYKNLESQKWVKLRDFKNKEKAEIIIDQAFQREKKRNK